MLSAVVEHHDCQQRCLSRCLQLLSLLHCTHCRLFSLLWFLPCLPSLPCCQSQQNPSSCLCCLPPAFTLLPTPPSNLKLLNAAPSLHAFTFSNTWRQLMAAGATPESLLTSHVHCTMWVHACVSSHVNDSLLGLCLCRCQLSCMCMLPAMSY